MKRTSHYLGSCALIFLFAAGNAWAADQEGEPGPIRSIHLHSNEASVSARWNWIVIAGESGDQTYYWGGSVCPGKHLRYRNNTDTMVDALAEYAVFPDMCITPFSRTAKAATVAW